LLVLQSILLIMKPASLYCSITTCQAHIGHLRHKLMPACIFKCCQKSLFRANDFVHSEQLNGFSTL
jgi:hypothetical protein